MAGTTQLFVANAQTGQELYFPNAQGINIPLVSPTIQDLNRVISQRAKADISASEEGTSEQSPLLGSHLKEAVAIVKDWVKDSKK